MRRRKRKAAPRPGLTIPRILAWADAHHARTGRWPSTESSNVQDAPGERWGNLDDSLRDGNRGLPGGDSLGRLLDRHRDRDQTLTIRQILAWADAHRDRRGQWPTAQSGRVLDAPGETWRGINGALDRGWRGLPGGDSVALVLQRHRGRARPRKTPKEDALVRRLPAAEVARRTGRSLCAIYQRRFALGVAKRKK
jgi:hypothetical protein